MGVLLGMGIRVGMMIGMLLGMCKCVCVGVCAHLCVCVCVCICGWRENKGTMSDRGMMSMTKRSDASGVGGHGSLTKVTMPLTVARNIRGQKHRDGREANVARLRVVLYRAVAY